jgi:hypothetical protein
MSNIPNKIRFCCLPVLPTVFSDELSYIEVLSKMRDYINQMIDALKQQDADIANIQQQVDRVDPSNYIQTSGGTLTGPLFFLDNAHVLKNEDGTITLSGTGLMNLHGGGNVTIDTPESIAIRADKAVDITGSTGVEILTGENGLVNIEGGTVAITGDINVHGTMKFDQTDTLDARGAGVLVDEPQVDGAPVNLKYFNEHKGSGGVTCGYITVAVDDSNTTVDVHNENLIPKGELGGYYVDNVGNLWHATQVVAGGFTLENQNINVLANAEFVRITGNTSVNNINVNDTGSSTYQAAAGVLVRGGTEVQIGSDHGGVVVGGNVVALHALQHVNIDAEIGGDIDIGVVGNIITLAGSQIKRTTDPTDDNELARVIDIARNSLAAFNTFTDAATNAVDYRVFMIASNSGSPIENVTAPVFMAFDNQERGSRTGIAIDSAGVIYSVYHSYSSHSFKMHKETPNASGSGLKLAELNGSNVCIPASAFNTAGPTTVWVNLAMDSAGTSYALGTVTMNGSNIADNKIAFVSGNSTAVATLTWQAGVGLVFDDSTIDESSYRGGVYAVVN